MSKYFTPTKLRAEKISSLIKKGEFEQFFEITYDGSDNIDLVLDLVKEAIGDFHERDFDGLNPLTTAVCVNNLNLVKLFIQSGANVNEENYDESVPLHHATTVDMLKFLIEDCNACINNTDRYNNTPLDILFHRNDIQDICVEYLTRNGGVLTPDNDD